MLTLTKTASAEAALHGIRVNAVRPGATGTKLLAGHNEAIGGPERAEAVMRLYQPLTGIISPDHVASAAVFLASDDSQSMVGTSILVGGVALANWDQSPNSLGTRQDKLGPALPAQSLGIVAIDAYNHTS